MLTRRQLLKRTGLAGLALALGRLIATPEPEPDTRLKQAWDGHVGPMRVSEEQAVVGISGIRVRGEGEGWQMVLKAVAVEETYSLPQAWITADCPDTLWIHPDCKWGGGTEEYTGPEWTFDKLARTWIVEQGG